MSISTIPRRDLDGARFARDGYLVLKSLVAPEQCDRLRETGMEYGASTGRPRRCGWYDAVAVRYAVRVNGIDSIALTKLDVLDGLDTIEICTGYKIGDRTVTISHSVLSADPVFNHAIVRNVEVTVHDNDQPGIIVTQLDQNTAGGRLGRQPARDVYGVAPQVVDELLDPDHAGYDRAGTNADMHAECFARGRITLAHIVLYVQRHIGDRFGIFGILLGQPSRRHIGIAYGLDFFDPMLLSQHVKP